jgi:hypothetical protein
MEMTEALEVDVDTDGVERWGLESALPDEHSQ